MASTKSSRSSKTTKSRISRMPSEMEISLVKAATKRAELQCRAEALAKKQDLESEAYELQKMTRDIENRKERLAIETELKIEDAKISVLEKLEEESQRGSMKDRLPSVEVPQVDKHSAVKQWLKSSVKDSSSSEYDDQSSQKLADDDHNLSSRWKRPSAKLSYDQDDKLVIPQGAALGPIYKTEHESLSSHSKEFEHQKITSKQYRTTSEEHRAISDRYRPTSEHYGATSDQYRPTSDNYRPKSEQYAGQYGATGDQYRPPDRPTSEQHGTTSNMYSPITQQHQYVEHVANRTDELLEHQTNLTKQLISHQVKTMLPQTKIPTYAGDPLEYANFMRAFEFGVEEKTDDPNERLYHLIEHTTGQAHSLVKSCLHLPKEEGYKEAKRLMSKQYGNKHKIVEAIMEKASKWPEMKVEDAKAMKEYALFLDECNIMMKGLNSMAELNHTGTIKTLSKKLPIRLRRKWRSKTDNIQEELDRVVSFSDLAEFVGKEARIANNPTYGEIGNQKAGESKKFGQRRRAFASTAKECKKEGDKEENATKTTSCLYCSKNNHILENCFKMKKLPVGERLQFLRKEGMCFGCLKKATHRRKECKARLKCNNCERQHPTVLHEDSSCSQPGNKNPEKSQEVGQKVEGPTVTCSVTGAGEGSFLPVIIPVKVRARDSGKLVETYALLDEGSNSVFCTEDLQRKLKTKGRKTQLTIQTLNQTKKTSCQILTELEVIDLHGDNVIKLSEVFTQKDLPASKEDIVSQRDIDSWPYLKEVQLPTIDSHEIGILIGNNVPKAMEPLKVIRSQQEGPFACLTRLGWTIHGVECKGSNRTRSVINRIDVKDVDLHHDLVKLYNMDFPERLVEDKQQHSKEDHAFMDFVSSSTRFVDGHYEVGLPFRSPDVVFPNNKPLAEQRAAHLRKKFRKDVKFKEEYTTFMNKMLDNDYAEEVPENEKERSDGRVWYIPHHGVFHPQKEKIRIVFDCAASYQGKSLNAELLQGPDLTSNLVGVLLRFRMEPIAFMADIKSMFHQVKVPKNDQDMLRFLWWRDGDDSQPAVEHRMKVHTFGATCSPACANYALQRTAEDAKVCDQEVRDTVKMNFYVDDCLKSVTNELEAIQQVQDLRKLCDGGGFHLTKWVSNCRAVLESLPEEEKAENVKGLDMNKDDLPSERALGMLWNVESDTFGCAVNIKQRPNTRRGILSIVSAVYDPLGFVAPTVLPAKIILQNLCRMQLGWDEEIPTNMEAIWREWIDDLPHLANFNTQRCFKPPNFKDIVVTQLHHFADASEAAYGTVSYLRLVDKEGKVHCQMVMGKSRVAPLKQISIPRLELTAATVAVRIDNLIKKELQMEPDTYFWTDSTTVLRYIYNQKTRFHTFVANRLSVIAEGSVPEQWKYVPTAENPADDCTRGIMPAKFQENERWKRGPEFLWKTEAEWPSIPISNINMKPKYEDDPEVRKPLVSAMCKREEFRSVLDTLLEHYSSWYQLKKSVAWLLKVKGQLLKQCRKKREAQGKTVQQLVHEEEDSGDNHMLTVNDLNKAEEEILKYVQSKAFSDEIKDLESKAGHSVKKSSDICRLDPQLKDGILRVGGRLRRSAMPEERKYPVILPKESKVTDMILQSSHESTGHSGRSHVISHTRRKYWIINVNSAARRIINKCILCKKQRGRVCEQKMSDLPEDRIVPDDPPFTKVGMDFFGPFEVKRGRVMEKRYGVVFTCLAVRAVHIEKACSLTTDGCISAIRRFVARRGQVDLIRSDNGSNIVGSQRELQREIRKWNQEVICDELRQQNIRWEFNPPGGSHFGGVWERQIRTIRKVMLSITKEQTLTDESLSTLLCEVEAIINSRPITKVSADVNDMEALTPNHLLLMKVKPNLPPTLTNPKDQYATRRWRQIQYLADLFWRRWTREYLPQLQERQKWNKTKPNVKPGDVVLLVDNTAPRNHWQMGRILKARPDDKGQVRSVEVKTKSGNYVRPVCKLIMLLEADSPDSDSQ